MRTGSIHGNIGEVVSRRVKEITKVVNITALENGLQSVANNVIGCYFEFFPLGFLESISTYK